MKKEYLLPLAALFLSSLALQSADLAAPPRHSEAPKTPGAADYNVVERGPHYRVIRGTIVETNFFDSQAIIRTNSFTYTELETGMHRKNSKGEFVEASDGIALAPGGAGTTNSAHQVFFAANANSAAALHVTLPDDRTTLKSHVMWLTYFDRESGSNAIIAEIRDSIGQIISANEVLYTNALVGDCVADILYHNTKAGIEQNIILRTQPPDPAEYGISNATLQVWSEFLGGPKPRRFASASRSGLDDEQLDFGAMKIGPGEAFAIDGGARGRVPVHKQWVELEGRTFLVEQVPVDPAVMTELLELPGSSTGAGGRRGGGQGAHGSIERRLPKVRFAETTTNTMQVVQLGTKPRPGFLLDYNLTSSTNFTFQADTTYYASGTVYLTGTNNVFEGGSVIKYAAGAGIIVEPLYGTTGAIFLGTDYRPTIFTAKDDDSVGDIISGSSHTPSGYYANQALAFISSQSPTLNHVRIAYASTAIFLNAASLTMLHGQIVKCQNGLTLVSAGVQFRNALFANNSTNFSFISAASVCGENLTIAETGWLAAGPSSPSGCGVNLTNCILSDVTNLTAGVISLSGDTNGFWNSPTFGNVITNTSYPFQAVGAASYYLANGCSFLNSGTTNINSALLTSLRQKTTFPPIVFSNATISADATFGPVAARDTAVSPSLGYHYDPLDYAFGGSHANANVTFAPGTAVGWFRTSSGWTHAGHGIHVGDTKTLLFDGRVDSPDYWVRCSVVQEGGTGKWDGGYGPGGITGWTILPNINQAPWLKAHFTKFSVLAGDSTHFRDDNGYLLVNAFACEFSGGGLGGYVDAVQFTNCLLDRVNWWLEGGRPETALTSENCTMHGGNVYINRWNDGVNGQTPVVIQDTSFDSTTFTTQDPYADNTNLTHCDFNAFQQGAARLYPQGSHDILVTNFNWQTSWLGNFYLPSNSPLINSGMVTANVLGLYHFTTQTNQVKEANSQVNIGYHYVAVDSNGKPVDTDGDGLADYFEDTNGNGLVDPGETLWDLAILATQPANQTVIEGNNAIFQVTAAGVAPLSYQWYFDGSAIAGATTSVLTLTGVQLVQAGDYSVTVGNALGTALSSSPAGLIVTRAQCVAPPLGLVSWWPANGDPNDVIGGNNGVLAGGASFVASRVGGGFSFNGISGALQVPDAPSLNFSPTSPITVELWAYSTGSQTVMNLFGKRSGNCSGDFNYQITCDTTNGLQFNGGTDAGLTGGVYTGVQMPLNTWMHLAVTFDGTTFSFYTNGVLAGIGTGTLGPTVSDPLTIGTSGACSYFAGMIDEVAIYNRSLSATEIAFVYNASIAGKCLDSAGSGLPDAWQYRYFGHLGVDPNADPDGDFLTNLQEFQRDTDPNNPDTDGDGQTDWQEVYDGTNPLNKLSKATWAVLAYRPSGIPGSPQGPEPLVQPQLSITFAGGVPNYTLTSGDPGVFYDLYGSPDNSSYVWLGRITLGATYRLFNPGYLNYFYGLGTSVAVHGYTPDILGRLKHVQDSEGSTVTYTYDNEGNITGISP
jgi:YD repeat-containing protein